jgi:hypothetical protein
MDRVGGGSDAFRAFMEESKALLRRASDGSRAGARGTSGRVGRSNEPSLEEKRHVSECESDPREGMTPAQLKAIKYLAGGASISTTAILARVHPERLRRWTKNMRFQEALLHERVKPSDPLEELRRMAAPGKEEK